MTDIALVGVPRSGTTLACNLLNVCSNTVALFEPMPVGELIGMSNKEAMCDAIEDYFQGARKTILNDNTAPSKQIGGSVPDNIFGSERTPDGLRSNRGARGWIQIDKPLSPDFSLAIKHNAAFTALLPDLAARLPCYAIIRNPLAVLASWNSCDLPVQRGQVPVGEGLDRELARSLARIPDRIDRQLHILCWFFESFARHLPPDSVIRYEDIVATRGRVLARICPQAAKLDEPLVNKNLNELYDRRQMSFLADKLSRVAGVVWEFYPKSCMDSLVSESVGKVHE